MEERQLTRFYDFNGDRIAHNDIIGIDGEPYYKVTINNPGHACIESLTNGSYSELEFIRSNPRTTWKEACRISQEWLINGKFVIMTEGYKSENEGHSGNSEIDALIEEKKRRDRIIAEFFKNHKK